jgi:hypothetical protein
MQKVGWCPKRFELVVPRGNYRIRELQLLPEDIGDCPHSELFPLKGVFQIRNFKQRVQINSFCKLRGSKFSRNCSSVVEALWVYELALLISDRPDNVSSLLQIGNYKSLIQLTGAFYFFANRLEYYFELGRWLCQFIRNDRYFQNHSDHAQHIPLRKLAVERFDNLRLQLYNDQV